MARPPTGRRELITSAALRAFTERGYESTTIGDLAAELDISKAAIAYYFPTKDTFLDEFVAPFLDDLDQAVPTSRQPAIDTNVVVGAYLDTLIAHHRVATWVDTDPIIQNHPVHGARLADINQRLIRRITNSSRRTADRARAIAVLGGLWRPARELTTEQLTQHRDDIIDAALVSYTPA